MSFQTAFESVRDGITDLSQLNVRTFTGEIVVTAAKLEGKDATLAGFLKEATQQGKLTVVGYTNMKIDGDVDQFISATAAESAIAAHNNAVQAGQASRAATLDLFMGLVREGIGKIKPEATTK